METKIDTTAIEAQVTLAVREAHGITITDDVELEGAGAYLCRIKGVLQEIDDTFDSSIKKAHATHKEMLAAKKKHADPLLQAERAVKRGIGDYQTEQRRLREIEQRRLQEIAYKEEEERRLAEAAQLEQEGETEAAEELISEPIVAPPVVLPKETKVAGVSTRTVYKWRLRKLAFVPQEYLMLDEKKINAVVRAMGAQTAIPGIEVYPENVVAARAG